MRLIILTLAWVTPAIIAEILGWRGIWGSGSAFGDALIPIPVAGGCLHVVSFCLSAAIVYREHRLPSSTQNILPIIAGKPYSWGQIALQIDYDRPECSNTVFRITSLTAPPSGWVHFTVRSARPNKTLPKMIA